MNSKVSIPSRSTITLDIVDADLVVGKNAIIKGTGTPPKVKVLGTVYCEGGGIFEHTHTIFECDLTARRLEAEQDVTINGNLDIEDKVEVEDGRLEVYGKMAAKLVDVGKALFVSKDLTSKEIDIGGSLKVDGTVTAEGIDVGGSFKAQGEVKAKEIDVGGGIYNRIKS
jgi:predicted acyltransferase (DUF342 family)